MPDATGLELIAHDLGEAVIETVYFRERATLEIDPAAIRPTLQHLREQGTPSWRACTASTTTPRSLASGSIYELLDMSRVDRITVKLRVPPDTPEVDSVTDEWPTANHQEREIYDMFGVSFEGHPDLRRILMPEDYEGHPQRRDFPVGGEPVIFTYDEAKWLESRA